MSTFIALFIITVIYFLILLTINHFKKWFNSRDRIRQGYRAKWREARNKRLEWKKEHEFSFDFHDPEYQTLWDIEIGCEAAYQILGTTGIGVTISWDDYCIESRHAKEKDSDD
jgi:hypothetical protein